MCKPTTGPATSRELRNVIERAVALCEAGEIRPRDLPEHLTLPLSAAPLQPTAAGDGAHLDAPIDLRRVLREQEVALIKAALRTTHGNQRLAAGLLKLPLRTLERKLRVLGIRERKAP